MNKTHGCIRGIALIYIAILLTVAVFRQSCTAVHIGDPDMSSVHVVEVLAAHVLTISDDNADRVVAYDGIAYVRNSSDIAGTDFDAERLARYTRDLAFIIAGDRDNAH